MGDIKFSIIIPHYNIPELLEKLLLTTPYDKEDVEVIVVDDRSDKNLEKLLEVKHRFGNMGVKFYRNNRGKKGAGTCRNIGMRHAAGKWLLFADADDRFEPETYGILKEYEESKADIIFFKSESVNEDGKRIQGRDEGYCRKIDAYLNDPGRRNELFIRYDMPVPWGKMIRHKIIEDSRIWFDEIPVSNDVMFSVKCGYYAGMIDVCEQKIYAVTERQDSLTTTYDGTKFRLRTDVFVNMCRFLKENLSRSDWNKLGFNGNIRLIEAYQRGYGLQCYLYIFLKLMCNGIKPVEFKGMSIKTAPNTLKNILREKRRH